MKNQILRKVLHNLKTKPHLLRKVKIFAAVGLVGFLVLGSLLVWAGFSTLRYIANQANQIVLSPNIQAQVETLKTEVKGMTILRPLNCWDRAQSLLAIQPWLERPALDNFLNLKVACLGNKPKACEGPVCVETEKQWETTEGTTI